MPTPAVPHKSQSNTRLLQYIAAAFIAHSPGGMEHPETATILLGPDARSNTRLMQLWAGRMAPGDNSLYPTGGGDAPVGGGGFFMWILLPFNRLRKWLS